jgi:hypothetical protein
VCFPDVPQGLSKKIKFNLLLPDLPLQVTDLLLRGRKVLRNSNWSCLEGLSRPACVANPVGSVSPVSLTPV